MARCLKALAALAGAWLIPSLTPVLVSPEPSSGLCWHKTCRQYICTHSSQTLIEVKFKNNLFNQKHLVVINTSKSGGKKRACFLEKVNGLPCLLHIRSGPNTVLTHQSMATLFSDSICSTSVAARLTSSDTDTKDGSTPGLHTP